MRTQCEFCQAEEVATEEVSVVRRTYKGDVYRAVGYRCKDKEGCRKRCIERLKAEIDA